MRRFLIYLWRRRVFVIFLLVSTGLWYISRLSHKYTTTTEIEVRITPDFGSDSWIEDSQIRVDATVEGDGRLLVLYKHGVMPTINIESSSLVLKPTNSPFLFDIEPASLQRALQAKEAQLTFLSFGKLPQLTISKLISKTVPIKSNITINCHRQYMIAGKVNLSQDSVVIKGPEIVLDTVHYISTRLIKRDELTSSVSGQVALTLPKQTLSNITSVSYRAEIIGFTEVEYHLPIEITNMPQGVICPVMVPQKATVKLKIPLGSTSQSIQPHARINYQYIDSLKNGLNLFPIRIDSLPKNAQLLLLRPAYVEPFFETIKNND